MPHKLKQSIVIPEVRFSEFSQPWEKRKIESIINSYRLGGNYSNTESKTKAPLVKMGNIGRGNINLNKIEYIPVGVNLDNEDQIKKNDLFFNTRNTLELVGKVAIWRNELEKAYYNSNLLRINFNCNTFMNYRFNSYQGIKAIRRVAVGTTSVAAVYTRDLLKLNLLIPSHETEQQKIASFLTAVDEKINLLRQKQDYLQTYKRGVMQKIFSQEIRFTQDDNTAFPDWEEKKLSDLTDKCTKKNEANVVSQVLTNSATKGVLNQQDYFDKSIANKDNLEGYYIVENGDYVYNPRISVHAPVGPINKNKVGQGVMSPLYSIFRFKSQNNTFYEQYFKTTFWHRYMSSVANYGARHDRMNISNVDFMAMPLPFPHIDEQKKIVEFIEALDHKIEAAKAKLEAMETFKKGLLQKMFV